MPTQIVHVLLQAAVLLLAARLGGEAARRLRQPAVAGELLAGVLVGPSLLGLVPALTVPGPGQSVGSEALALDTLAEFGVLLLLFLVGLECSVRDFRRVAPGAAAVGTLGVLVSLLAGAGASLALAHVDAGWLGTPSASAQPWLLHLFVGATFTATSVGITARVLRELGLLGTNESQVILGAAVLDDILGLVVLGALGALAAGASPGALELARLVGTAALFVALALTVGAWLGRRAFGWLGRHVRGEHGLLALAVAWMLALAGSAAYSGLAPIVGAFAAGLALSSLPRRHELVHSAQPVAGVFVGLFFAAVGARVDLRDVLAQQPWTALGTSVALAAVAVAAKLAAGAGVLRVRASRLVVGVGMVPRGEVGLIFALFGLTAGLVSSRQYGVLVLSVLLTTIVAPPWLARLRSRFTVEAGRGGGGAEADAAAGAAMAETTP